MFTSRFLPVMHQTPARVADIDRFFENFMSPMWSFRDSEDALKDLTLRPTMDVVSDDKAYTMTVELPGVNPEDVHVELQSGNLIISGEKKCETENKEKHYSERSYGSFKRILAMPEDAVLEEVKASHKDGILSISIPRKNAELESQKNRCITVEKA